MKPFLTKNTKNRTERDGPFSIKNTKNGTKRIVDGMIGKRTNKARTIYLKAFVLERTGTIKKKSEGALVCDSKGDTCNGVIIV